MQFIFFQTTSAYVGASPSGASYANQANSYAAGVQNSSAGTNSYGNAYSSTAAATQAYPAAAYASVTQTPNSYQTGGQPSYASAQNSNSQSVYGANTGTYTQGVHFIDICMGQFYILKDRRGSLLGRALLTF